MACWWMKLLSTLSSHPHTDILCQAAGKSHWLAHLYFYTEQFLQNGWGCFILHDRRHNSGKSQRWRNTLHMRKISSSFLFPSFLSLGQGLAKQNKLVWKSQQFPSSAFWVLLLKTRLMPARKTKKADHRTPVSCPSVSPSPMLTLLPSAATEDQLQAYPQPCPHLLWITQTIFSLLP